MILLLPAWALVAYVVARMVDGWRDRRSWAHVAPLVSVSEPAPDRWQAARQRMRALAEDRTRLDALDAAIEKAREETTGYLTPDGFDAYAAWRRSVEGKRTYHDLVAAQEAMNRDGARIGAWRRSGTGDPWT